LLLAGVIEETIEKGRLLPKLPLFTINAKSIVYNRESTLPSAAFYDIHEQIPWTADVTYATQIEVALKRIARSDVLDHFMMLTYKTPQDYKALILKELVKGCLRTIEDKIIYGNTSSDAAEFDGLHKIAADGYCAIDTDEGGALSLANLREAIDAVKYDPKFILMPFELQRRMDAAIFEAGISANSIIRQSIDGSALGERVTWFEGVPIIPTDYLVAELDDSPGTKYTTGTKNYTMFIAHLGQITDGGLCMCTGAGTGGFEFYKITELDELEDYDASGIKLVAYCALALGSTKALARIHDITDAAITA